MADALKLPANATLHHVAELAASLPEALPASSASTGEPWRIDASGLKAVDSSTIALLLQARRLALAAGQELQVHDVPEKLLALARLYGVESLLASASTSSAPSGSASPANPAVAAKGPDAT